AQKIIDSALDFAKGDAIYFTFQGGEPLLSGIDFFVKFVKYCEEKNTDGSQINYCLQTNGTLINDEFARFFRKNNFLIGVSLDGDEDINSYRLYPDGSSSFDDVMRGVELLKKYDVTFNILSVLTKNTALNFRRAYRFFKQNGLRHLQFIPCLRPLKSEYDEDMYMNNDDYSYFLTKCFNIYFNDYMRGEYVSVRSFDNYIALMNGNNAEQCGMNGFCSTQFVVEGDGSVYPCDFYCTDEWYLGNINQDSFKNFYNSERAVEFLKGSFKLDDKCRQCSFFTVCRGGGCKRSRQDMDYCGAYKAFFSSSSDKMIQMKR
ncbi:MAG: SPASM domain-containing protein, partial [Eubacterium sp.]